MFLGAKLRKSNKKLKSKFNHDEQLKGHRTNLNGNQSRQTEIDVKHLLILLKKNSCGKKKRGEKENNRRLLSVFILVFCVDISLFVCTA